MGPPLVTFCLAGGSRIRATPRGVGEVLYLYLLHTTEHPTLLADLQPHLADLTRHYAEAFGTDVRVLGGHIVEGPLPTQPDSYVVATCLSVMKREGIDFESSRDEISYSVDHVDGVSFGGASLGLSPTRPTVERKSFGVCRMRVGTGAAVPGRGPAEPIPESSAAAPSPSSGVGTVEGAEVAESLMRLTAPCLRCGATIQFRQGGLLAMDRGIRDKVVMCGNCNSVYEVQLGPAGMQLTTDVTANYQDRVGDVRAASCGRCGTPIELLQGGALAIDRLGLALVRDVSTRVVMCANCGSIYEVEVESGGLKLTADVTATYGDVGGAAPSPAGPTTADRAPEAEPGARPHVQALIAPLSEGYLSTEDLRAKLDDVGIDELAQLLRAAPEPSQATGLALRVNLVRALGRTGDARAIPLLRDCFWVHRAFEDLLFATFPDLPKWYADNAEIVGPVRAVGVGTLPGTAAYPDFERLLVGTWVAVTPEDLAAQLTSWRQDQPLFKLAAHGQNVRLNLVGALTKIEDPSVRDVLLEILDVEGNQMVLTSAVEALAKRRDLRDISRLIGYLRDTVAGRLMMGSDVRELVDALADFGDEESRAALLEYHASLTDKSKRYLRDHVAERLGLEPEKKRGLFGRKR
ncbi:MAG: hypothetical protein WD770_09930 [Actinomycetota bacterium]